MGVKLWELTSLPSLIGIVTLAPMSADLIWACTELDRCLVALNIIWGEGLELTGMSSEPSALFMILLAWEL